MTGVLMRRDMTQRERHTQGECHVMMEVDIGVIQLQANNGKDLPIPEVQMTDCPLEVSERTVPCQ